MFLYDLVALDLHLLSTPAASVDQQVSNFYNPFCWDSWCRDEPNGPF